MQNEPLFGTDAKMTSLMRRRKSSAVVWKVVFLFSTSLAILFLVLLLVSVIDSTVGYVAVRYEVEPHQLVSGKDSVGEFTVLNSNRCFSSISRVVS